MFESDEQTKKPGGEPPGVFRMPISEAFTLVAGDTPLPTEAWRWRVPDRNVAVACCRIAASVSNAFVQFVGALNLRCVLEFGDNVGELITSYFLNSTCHASKIARVPLFSVPDNSADRVNLKALGVSRRKRVAALSVRLGSFSTDAASLAYPFVSVSTRKRTWTWPWRLNDALSWAARV